MLSWWGWVPNTYIDMVLINNGHLRNVTETAVGAFLRNVKFPRTMITHNSHCKNRVLLVLRSGENASPGVECSYMKGWSTNWESQCKHPEVMVPSEERTRARSLKDLSPDSSWSQSSGGVAEIHSLARHGSDAPLGDWHVSALTVQTLQTTTRKTQQSV